MVQVPIAEFHDQYLLTRGGDISIGQWNHYSLFGYDLRTHPSLPVTTVRDANGRQVGFAIGHLINTSGDFFQTDVRLPFVAEKILEEPFESFIYQFGGRYVFLLLTPNFQRVYLDPAGTLATVFCGRRQRVGSTTSLVLCDEPEHPFFSKPTADFPNDRVDQFYPAGLTSDPEIFRLLPNHYLDLKNWKAIRHYPRHSLRPIRDHEIPDCVERVRSLVSAHIAAVVRNTPKTYMGLTAGRDTRILLACAKDIRERIEFVTFDCHALGRLRSYGRRYSYRADKYISKRLVRRFQLKRTVLPVSPDIPQAVEESYLRRIGFAAGAGKSRDFFLACRDNLDLSGAWLTGFGSGVGKANYSRQTDKSNRTLDAAELLDRIRLLQSGDLQNAMKVWLSELVDVPTSSVVEFAYLEHRLGCWASPHLYGTAPFSVNLIPFAHREIFDIMVRLPLEYRQRKAFAKDLIAAAWPELLRLPINDFTGPKLLLERTRWKAMTGINRILSLPHRLLRSMRT